MHFSIPETEVRSGENGSTYVVSVLGACWFSFLSESCQQCFKKKKNPVQFDHTG